LKVKAVLEMAPNVTKKNLHKHKVMYSKIIILGTFSLKNIEQMTEKFNTQRACYRKSQKQNITNNNKFEHLKHDLFHF